MAIELWVSGNFSQEHLGYLQRSLMEKAKHNTDIGMKIKLLGREGSLVRAFNFVACFMKTKSPGKSWISQEIGSWGGLRVLGEYELVLSASSQSNTNPTAFPSYNKVMQLQDRLLRGVPLTQELSLSVQSHLLLWQPWWKKPFCVSPGLSQRNAQVIYVAYGWERKPLLFSS